MPVLVAAILMDLEVQLLEARYLAPTALALSSVGARCLWVHLLLLLLA